MHRARWRSLIACLAILAAVMAVVGGGSAANRDGEVTFEAVPGPGAVTYGENIAYSSTFDNTSGAVFTQVRFLQTRPSATLEGKTYTADVAKTSCAASAWFIDTKNDTDATNDEFVCNVAQQLRPEDVPAKIVVVWTVPGNIESVVGCLSCLKTKGSWQIKERKATNGNETFPKTGPIEVTARLLGGQGTEETLTAGGYELAACTGGSSLQTNQALSAGNPVSSSFCLPPFATTDIDLGLATTITEEAGNAQKSVVCIAALGENCGANHDDAVFAAPYVTHVFRVLDSALPNGYKITEVRHNGELLPRCSDAPDNANGCVVDIQPPQGQPKIWVIIATSPTNGPWSW